MADDFLPRRPFAVLSPEPGGFEAALARGRRRRLRTTGGGALASIVAVALAMNLVGSSPDSAARLEFNEDIQSEIVDDPRPPARGADDDTDTDEVTEDLSDEPIVPGTQRTGPGRGAAPAVQPGAPAGPDGAAVRPPAGRPAPQSRKRTLPDPSIRLIPRGHPECVTYGGLDVAEQWCIAALHQENFAEDAPPHARFLRMQVCSSFNNSATRLRFNDNKVVDFVVTEQGSDEELWRWSFNSVPRPGAVSHDVAPGDCLEFSIDWERQDNAGRLIVKPGQYVVTATSFARELGSSNQATTEFTHS